LDRAVFEHDGAPFSSEELAALLSGGSSKEFGSETTTGRFGTGFLVTHVLAERTILRGLLALSTGLEVFQLTLDRSGDEAAILANIDECNEAIKRARPLADPDGLPSAHFEYPLEDDQTLALGVQAFRQALPYVYGTRPELGEVSVQDTSGVIELWSAEDPIRTQLASGQMEDRLIRVEAGHETRQYHILRFTVEDQPLAAALVLCQLTGDEWEVVLPAQGGARIYSQYPLRDSDFLPVEFVFDGRFEPDQERGRALMNDSDKRGLSEAFTAAVIAANQACDERWRNAHLLARAAAPRSGFDAHDEDERSWWREQIQSFAVQLAQLPIIETGEGYLAAVVADGPFADFVSPRLLDPSGPDETSVDRMWPLIDEATELYPPIEGLAQDWSETAAGWSGLDLKLNRVTIDVLSGYVREGAVEVGELRVLGDPNDWLARYIDVVSECWEQRSGIETRVFEGLLPNQNGLLCSPHDLRRDAGVPEELKDICQEVGLDVRGGLLSRSLIEAIGNLQLEHATRGLEKAIPAIADGDGVVDELLEYLMSTLPEDEDCSEENVHVQRGTARLLRYLWETRAGEAATIAHRVPLVTRGEKVIHWSSERTMMAPVGAWGEEARPFSDAYPADRILSDIYLTDDNSIVASLEAWGMAFPDPITTSTPRELDGPRLAAMVLDGFDSDGVTVRGEEFSHIALLPREVINHIQDFDEARALLGLVLCHVARNDPGWRERRSVQGWRARERVDVPVRGALWLGDLGSRAWVPVKGEDERPAMASPDASTLRPLIDPSWLEDNDEAIALLTQCFGFDELELRLLGIAPDVQERVRQGLARLLESGGADPEFYEALAEEVEARQRRRRDVERARRMGYAVQDAIRQALESHGLEVRIVDRGFDYEVAVPGASEALEDVAARFEVGPFFVEVKATSTGPVRLTPTQAETATGHSARYVLCVVDLRDIPDERLDMEWTGSDVEPLASVLSDVGSHVGDTFVLVRRARDSAVGIRNEGALRYEVPPDTWERGVSIGDWITLISSDPDIRAASDTEPL
jgi:hypothetical protein